ncbi:Vestitone reductase [Bertholletia excelsa]
MEGGKGTVCVTGGTGYVASWMIKKLLEEGYSVRTTSRSYPDPTKDLSYLTSLPGASERLQIFDADLARPESFRSAVEGCIGVFHVAHPIDFEDKEPEEVKSERAISGTLGLLRACLDSETVRRVVYTSSASTVMHNPTAKDEDELDEGDWSEVDYVRSSKVFGGSYRISKTLTEKAALEFAEKNGLDLVSVIPTFINGPFVCPRLPGSVRTSMAMIFGNEDEYQQLFKINMVHVDDVAAAHIFLLHYPEAKGRYICSSVGLTFKKMSEFLSARYPQYSVPTPDSLKGREKLSYPSVSSKKLLDTGFQYKYGLDEIYDQAVECCKEKGFL